MKALLLATEPERLEALASYVIPDTLEDRLSAFEVKQG